VPGIGRPKRISREVLEDAATELFLERGYSAVSVDDIAKRAGVSRATFFNYFSAKVDVLFVELDLALDQLEHLLATGLSLEAALRRLAAEADTRDVPLIARQAEVMGAQDDVLGALPSRMWRLRELVGKAVPDPAWQWAIAGAIAHGTYLWATGASRGVEESISAQLDQLATPPEILSHFVR
jgi:AcrR family transcriptional regulator